MGGTLMLMMEKGEIGKVKTVLLNKSLKTPVFKGEKYPADCWIDYCSNVININFTLGNHLCNSQWAIAIAKEILKRFKVKNAGWDSVGYCGVDEFKKAYPFCIYLEEKGILGMLSQLSHKKRFRELRKMYESAAEKLFTE